MRRVLVTGAGGFLGSYVAADLATRGFRVVATVRRESTVVGNGGFETAVCDLLDPAQVDAIVQAVEPQVVVHLAAQSLPSVSWEQPGTTFEINVLGTLNLLEAIRRLAHTPLALLAGSSSEYAPSPVGEVLHETAPIDPWSPYGVSKASAWLLARLYALRYGMRIIWLRPFQIIGPRKVGDVCSNFARSIAAIERGVAADFPVGNLEVVRDFLDVRDAVKAVSVLMTHSHEPGTCEPFNVCSGTGRRIADVLEYFVRASRADVLVQHDPLRLRPLDQPVVIGDNAKLRSLGWHPVVPFEETVESILDYWRTADTHDAKPSMMGGRSA